MANLLTRPDSHTHPFWAHDLTKRRLKSAKSHVRFPATMQKSHLGGMCAEAIALQASPQTWQNTASAADMLEMSTEDD